MTSPETSVSEAEVEAAAEIIWNDRDGKMGGVWATMPKDWTVAIQTLATARAALTAAAQMRAQAGEDEQVNGNLRVEALLEALRSADYYIGNLERVQQRKIVRDMTESMEWYRRTGPGLIAAYEREYEPAAPCIRKGE